METKQKMFYVFKYVKKVPTYLQYIISRKIVKPWKAIPILLHDTSSRVSRILQVQTKLNHCPKLCCCTLQAFSKRFFFLNWKTKSHCHAIRKADQMPWNLTKSLPFLDFQKLHKLPCNYPLGCHIWNSIIPSVCRIKIVNF